MRDGLSLSSGWRSGVTRIPLKFLQVVSSTLGGGAVRVVTSIPSWAGETTAVVRRAEVAVVRPRQDPLGWEADRSAAGDHSLLS